VLASKTTTSDGNRCSPGPCPERLKAETAWCQHNVLVAINSSDNQIRAVETQGDKTRHPGESETESMESSLLLKKHSLNRAIMRHVFVGKR
jgi:hypothetical protein